MTSARLAVIPARGGSKRVPRKNIRAFCGRPMIEYAIDAARQSRLFDHIVVSTDDAEIAEVARRAGAELPFLRPAALADDLTATVAVVAHAIGRCQALGWTVDAVCCIYPGVPLLSPWTLAEGWTLLEAGNANYVFPVLAFESPIQRALVRDADGQTRPVFPEYAQTRTQDLPHAYHDAGQFYWGATTAWLGGLSLHANARTLVMPADSVVDIDTDADWLRAEARYLARNRR